MRTTLLAPATIAVAAPDIARGEGRSPVAEIVTFRLVAGGDPAAFALSAEGMTPFLRSTGALLSRRLSVDETGLWTDHLVWSGMAAAKDAAARIMQEPAAAPFMALIDPESVEMRHAEIRFSLTME